MPWETFVQFFVLVVFAVCGTLWVYRLGEGSRRHADQLMGVMNRNMIAQLEKSHVRAGEAFDNARELLKIEFDRVGRMLDAKEPAVAHGVPHDPPRAVHTPEANEPQPPPYEPGDEEQADEKELIEQQDAAERRKQLEDDGTLLVHPQDI